jgi:fluoroquinolone resistance protein
MSFTEKDYYRRNFMKLSLSSAAVEGRSFEECEFNACSFIDCRFESCRFLSCKLNGCTLSAVNPSNSRFLEVKFSGSKVIGFDWAKAHKIEGLEFKGCQLNYSNFSLLKLPKIKIIDCEAKEVEFIETDMSHGVFCNTDFTKSRFFKTNLSDADFRGAKNYFIDVRNNVIRKARFSLPEAITLLNSLDIILE